MTLELSDIARPRRRGPISSALVGLFMKPATVTCVDTLNPDFFLVTLQSPAFVGLAWMPGQKVQITIGASLSTRTYTPIDWDASKGETLILVYAHGPGPGSRWVQSLQVGDICDVFGPRASLDLARLKGPVVVFGDETSFGLSIALSGQQRTEPVDHLFEVNAQERARSALKPFDLSNIEVFLRTPDDDHLSAIETRLSTLAAPETNWVLTGKAGSVQRLHRFLKTLSPIRAITKAYWAPGKTGLD